MIPIFVEIEAAEGAGYQYFGNWMDLEHDYKAVIVAHHLAKTLIEGRKQDVQSREMKRKGGRKGR